jgi:hypothetical protein
LAGKAAGLVWITVLFLHGCGTVDPGERTISRWRTAPDPVVFADDIHPILTRSCAAAGCHARTSTFTLHPTEERLPDGADIQSPADLPPPFKEDYYTVMAFCDLDFEQSSPLLQWGSGEQELHPGANALSIPDRDIILEWLEGD